MSNIRKTIMVFTMIFAIALSFTSKYDSLMDEMKSNGSSKQSSINDYIVLSSSFIENLTTFGDDFLHKGYSNESPIMNFIKYDSFSNSYNLDAVGNTEYEKKSGTITGIGSIPSEGSKRKEIELCFEYNKYFNKFYDRLPGIAWLYYTSENNFIFMYPWISSKDFKFTESLKQSEYYEHVNPENNPNRMASWSHVYEDHAGKGLMVTLSSPIYDENNFKGVVSIDLTNKKFSELLNSKDNIYLIDDINCIIASSKNPEAIKKITKIGNALNIPENDVKLIKEQNNQTIQVVGDYYVYAEKFNEAPWTLLVLVPVYKIIGKSLLYTLPVVLICILFIQVLNEAEFRKKTEKMLKNMAVTDQLTGLNNRYSFDDKVLEEMHISEKLNKPLSMIIFDLDFFKKINDTWGHPVGDEVLKKTAEAASTSIRKTDMVFRIGGEEFAVLLPNT
ncbi:MAG: diguanylate cyclase, partial [Solirubrobacterales bacterium]